MRVRIVLAVLCLPLLASSASALPIVSVAPANTNVGLSDSFSVDIIITDVDVGAPLNAFEFDLLFDPSVLSATAVVDGGFLLDPKIVVQLILGVMSVEFAEVTLFAVGASGSGTLATIMFDAVGFGTSALDLDNVILSAPFGILISTDAIEDGSVTVPVPEPSSVLMFAAGLLLVARRCRSFARYAKS